MNEEKLKKALPTLMGILERRRKKAQNQLPRHLRPLPLWPVLLQMLLNAGLIITMSYLMMNRDEFMSEASPAVGLVLCLLVLIYTLIAALQLKQRYAKTPLYRWAKLNIWLMGLAAFLFPASVAFFLP